MKAHYWLAIILACITGIALNIGLHETGHYLAATNYSLQPEFHLENNMTHISTNTFLNPVVAYVSYISESDETTYKDALIAFCGPLVNLALSGIFLSGAFFSRKYYTKQQLLLLVIISLVSAGINLLPLEHSDGLIVFQYLFKNF